MTALQELIAKWETAMKAAESVKDVTGLETACASSYATFIADAKRFLEKEREQIETAYYEGGDAVCPNGDAGSRMAARYYESISNGTTSI
jgi:hypothetical protein